MAHVYAMSLRAPPLIFGVESGPNTWWRVFGPSHFKRSFCESMCLLRLNSYWLVCTLRRALSTLATHVNILHKTIHAYKSWRWRCCTIVESRNLEIGVLRWMIVGPLVPTGCLRFLAANLTGCLRDLQWIACAWSLSWRPILRASAFLLVISSWSQRLLGCFAHRRGKHDCTRNHRFLVATTHANTLITESRDQRALVFNIHRCTVHYTAISLCYGTSRPAGTVQPPCWAGDPESPKKRWLRGAMSEATIGEVAVTQSSKHQ